MSEIGKLATAYLSLLSLLALTVGSSYLDLGGFNSAVNLLIAAAKGAIIAFLFMQVLRQGVLTWLAIAAIGLWLSILYGLTLAA
jgi:cytochrome c oxidase subunit 4